MTRSTDGAGPEAVDGTFSRDGTHSRPHHCWMETISPRHFTSVLLRLVTRAAVINRGAGNPTGPLAQPQVARLISRP